MDRKNIIMQLRKARRAHLRWREHIRSLVEGSHKMVHREPLHSGECFFGRWYYGEGQKLLNLPSFQEIDGPHERLHSVYQEISKYLVNEYDRGVLTRLFRSRGRSSSHSHGAILSLHDEFERSSDQFLRNLDALENDIIKFEDENSDTRQMSWAGYRTRSTNHST